MINRILWDEDTDVQLNSMVLKCSLFLTQKGHDSIDNYKWIGKKTKGHKFETSNLYNFKIR